MKVIGGPLFFELYNNQEYGKILLNSIMKILRYAQKCQYINK